MIFFNLEGSVWIEEDSSNGSDPFSGANWRFYFSDKKSPNGHPRVENLSGHSIHQRIERFGFFHPATAPSNHLPAPQTKKQDPTTIPTYHYLPPPTTTPKEQQKKNKKKIPCCQGHSGCQALVNQEAFRAASALKRFIGSLLSSCCSNSWASIEMALHSWRNRLSRRSAGNFKKKTGCYNVLCMFRICVYIWYIYNIQVVYTHIIYSKSINQMNMYG